MAQNEIEKDILEYLAEEGPANKRFIRRALASQWEVRITYSMVEPMLEKLCNKGALSTEESGTMVNYKISYEQKRDLSASSSSVKAD